MTIYDTTAKPVDSPGAPSTRRLIDSVKVITSHPMQSGSFRRHSSQPISWPSTEKLNQM